MFRSGPSTDIGGRIESRDQHPGIIQNLLAFERIQLGSGVNPRPDAPQPALAGPAREQLGGLRPSDGKRGNDIINLNNVIGLPDHGYEFAPAPRYRYLQCAHIIPTVHHKEWDLLLV